ncbi:MAG: class I SAM-dependent RNA methyltransferase [Clostridiales bacterium]|jgi:putative N6-adenine-specific DNA methylase|nr:class I SAM-dependent RNA methyltransferase [Clostridiales bacterium]
MGGKPYERHLMDKNLGKEAKNYGAISKSAKAGNSGAASKSAKAGSSVKAVNSGNSSKAVNSVKAGGFGSDGGFGPAGKVGSADSPGALPAAAQSGAAARKRADGEWLLSAPTIFGLESVAAREIRDLGYYTDAVENGRVSFWGDGRAICRSNLWLRTAERVQVKMGGFAALTFDELFEGVRALPWPDLLPADAVFPVSGHSLSSKLFSVPDCQAIIKKAVAESMKSRYGGQRCPETGSLYRVQFNIIRDSAALYVDTSGEGLHKRGYRDESVIAPIKETLAAALVKLSGWRPGHGLWDPFCGSGTIVIEAAMMAANIAPGLNRQFAAEQWAAPGKKVWEEERQKARAAMRQAPEHHVGAVPQAHDEQAGLGRAVAADAEGGQAAGGGATEAALVGSDVERRAIAISRQNAKKAGVSQYVRFFQMDAKDMAPGQPRLKEMGAGLPEAGAIVSNPPYGERMDEAKIAEEAVREWAPALGAFRHWNWNVISTNESFEKNIGRAANKKRKLYNGMIKCYSYQFFRR